MSLSIEATLDKYQDDIYIILYKILNLCTGSLNNPCYNPPVSANLKSEVMGLWKKISSEGGFDFEKGIKENYIKKTIGSRLLSDVMSWFLTLTSIHFYMKSNPDGMIKDLVFLPSYLLYLKYYTALSNKHMPRFCDKDKANLALSLLSDKSLFSSKNIKVLQYAKTIINEYGLNSRIKNGIQTSNIAMGIVYLYDKIKDVYYIKVKKLNDVKSISKVIMASRDRLSQSFKAYAEQYYKVINTNIQTDFESDSDIINSVNRVMSSSSQGMVYIPDTHYKTVMKMTQVPVKYLTTMFDTAFKNLDNSDKITPEIINIILREKKKEFETINDINEWLIEVSRVIAIRSKYDIRDMIISLIRSNEELLNIFDNKSISFKHKFIQAMGLVIGLAVFDTLKQYMLGHIKSIYVID